MISHTVPFGKGYTAARDLVSLLQERGLFVSNTSRAEHFLEHIGYYRLSADMYPLLKIPKNLHLYKEGATFEQVMMLYRFDKKLRMFLFNEIEKIEVAVRCAIVNIGSFMTRDPFWMIDSANFVNQSKFLKTMDLIGHEMCRSREEFIIHFKETYSDPYPPAWIISEILPFGIITNIYNNIRDKKIKKRISQSFGLQIAPFESWLTIVTLTRNACCHHSRVWNKQNTIRPMAPNITTHPWVTLQTDSLRIYYNICIIKYFLDVISPNNDMLQKMKMLFTDFPEVDLHALGFPHGWEEEPLWRI